MISVSQMVEIIPRQDQLDRAIDRFSSLVSQNKGDGRMNRHSKMGGQRTTGAFLAEEVFHDHCIDKGLKLKNVSETNLHYDFEMGSCKVDLKTKYCSTPPRPSYNCTIYEYEVSKESTHFIFCRLLFNKAVPQDNLDRYLKVYLLGQISKHRFLKLAKKVEAGQPDPFGDGKGIVDMTEDCRAMQIMDLSPFNRI